ncbi:MAG: ThiF family adenylyltransferase [Candidatus Omnitrophota bacterium]|nr:ThiF family adenylyltransferase [Candidatus Omnitrophota bacterium]
MSSPEFDYSQAFDRNIGWLTKHEQEKLRGICVAIAGLGGAGGFQAQALARLGVGKYRIADPDTFEISNRNRQIGATESTVGHPKATTIRDMILAINPTASVEIYPECFSTANAGAILESADVAIDGIDFFSIDDKILFFQECRKRGIPAITSCPLGFGASLMVFSPQGMTFEDYFNFRPDMSEKDKRNSFAFGLSPSPLCLSYMNPDAFGSDNKRAASVVPGLMLVGALTATEVVKLVTHMARPNSCPHVYQIDLMTQRVSKKYYRWGMRGPWMRCKKALALKWVEYKRRRHASNPSLAASPPDEHKQTGSARHAVS